jgi:hypothetical protein
MTGEMVLVVFKDGKMVMGLKSDSLQLVEDSSKITLTDCVQIDFVQTGPQSIQPAPSAFPHPFIDDLLSKEGKERKFTFSTDEVYIYNENELKSDTVKFFERILAKKNSGIDIVQNIPQGAKIIS